MKSIFIFLISLLFANVVFADVNGLDPVNGNWSVKARFCSSGAPVADGFLIGTDEMYLSFKQGKYESHTRIMKCNYWVEGNYQVNGNILHLFGIVGASNCTNLVPHPEGNVLFTLENDILNIVTGPFAMGGSCPRGDYLQTKFNRM